MTRDFPTAGSSDLATSGNPSRSIIGRLDALDAGDVGLFLCSDGDIGAHISGVSVKGDGVSISLTGYGATAEAALIALWGEIETLPRSQYLIIRVNGSERRAVRWNGHAWKPVHDEAAQAKATDQ
jgi:hypothetical protein